MTSYPAYVQQLLAQAREEGQWHCGQTDAAALCYEVLALFPDHAEAAALIHNIFCDAWLIYDNRVALQRHIEEWDDRPWQQRRRLALSFRFMSRWVGWQREYEEGYEQERTGPPDVAELLEAGRGQLLHAYCLGDNECTTLAWSHFEEAVRRTNDPRLALLWVGKQYADLGFLADAAEVLGDLVHRFNDPDARRLLAEVRWWRDNGHRLPWLPPAGDGSRYKRMMQHIDPEAPDDEAIIRHLRREAGLPDPAEPDAAFHEAVESALTGFATGPDPAEARVDWGFLDEDDGQPGPLPEWVHKMMALMPPEIAAELADQHRWTRPIPPPATPPRYNPNDPPFDPGEFFGGIEA